MNQENLYPKAPSFIPTDLVPKASNSAGYKGSVKFTFEDICNAIISVCVRNNVTKPERDWFFYIDNEKSLFKDIIMYDGAVWKYYKKVDGGHLEIADLDGLLQSGLYTRLQY